MNQARSWALLVAQGRRDYAGNRGYDDDPARVYRYDSKVPNSTQVAAGDVALIRNHDRLLGIAVVARVISRSGTKTLLRCRKCGVCVREMEDWQPIFLEEHQAVIDLVRPNQVLS